MCFIISRQSFRLCCKVVPTYLSLSGFEHQPLDQGGVTGTFYWEGEQPHYWSSISFLCFYIFPNKGSNVCSIESWRDCLFLLFFPKESICLFFILRYSLSAHPPHDTSALYPPPFAFVGEDLGKGFEMFGKSATTRNNVLHLLT